MINTAPTSSPDVSTPTSEAPTAVQTQLGTMNTNSTAPEMPVAQKSNSVMVGMMAVLLLIVLAGGVYGYTYWQNSLVQVQTQEAATPELKVATDPTFPEYLGEIPEEVPSLPAYANAELIGTALTTPNTPGGGYHIKWDTTGDVTEVMNWYITELRAQGWIVTISDDTPGSTEQISYIENQEYTGYIAVEVEEENVTEIVIDIKKRL